MSRTSAGACLGAIHGVLIARGIPVTRDRVGGGRSWVEGACVACVSERRVVVSRVVSFCDRVVEVLAEKVYEPTPYTPKIKAIAMEVEMRVHLNRAEQVKYDTWRRAKLAGHKCGKDCRESLCGIHSRPAVRACDAGKCVLGSSGRCKACGTVMDWDAAARAEEVMLHAA